MDLDLTQPVIPLGGFAQQPAGHIELKMPLYVTALNSLYTLLPSHFLALTSTTYPVSPKESRERLVNTFSTVAWPQLSSFLTQVFEAKKATLRGKPDAAFWQAELALLRAAHQRVARGY